MSTFAPTVVLAICATWTGPLRGEALYSQITPSPPVGAFSSNDAGNPTDQKIADNFLFDGPGPVTIRSLRFIGGYGVRNPPPSTPPLDALPPDNFRVAFLTDSAGTPGLPLAGGDFHVAAAARRTATGGPLLNGVVTPLEYILDFGTGITVSPSTVYWVSIVNNPGTNYSWAWARAAGVFDQQTAGTFGDITTGTWSVVNNGGMFFELSDNNVPEPTYLGIILAGSCGASWIRLTRRSKR